ncbi:DUF1660 family phage protein [Chishuiella sp.]
MKLYCKFNIHKWNYTSKTLRTCCYCNKTQEYINEGPVSGFGDFSY